ncbi:hypothetical protein [Sphingomonas sp. DT-204]|uniref:hypothetical protein n=1 Tax=Sphingomonas sp. DT-204 TaxID=3396166 RepID=UPI003F1B2666
MAPRPLSAAELLDAVSVCRDKPAIEAGVYLAALNLSEISFDACERLAIGARDSVLAGLHAAMFGRRLELAATCPDCGARLDVSFTTDALQIESAAGTTSIVEIGGQRFGVRPANSVDLAAVADIPDVEVARELLAIRCLMPAKGESAPATLSEIDLGAVAAALAKVDPASDPYVSLTCFECEATWEAPIDIARILASEIEGAADALMDDIHDLALAYHWSEEAILALAPARRRAYLQRLRA